MRSNARGAQARRANIIVSHHDRKMDADDVFDTVSGTALAALQKLSDELGLFIAPYWGVTHDQSQVCSPGRGRQGDELRALESPNRAGHRDKLLSFIEFPVASAIGFRRR